MTEQEFVLRILSTESGCNSYTFEDAKKLYKEIVKKTSNIELSQKEKIDVIISWIRKSDCDPDYLIKMLEDLKNGK